LLIYNELTSFESWKLILSHLNSTVYGKSNKFIFYFIFWNSFCFLKWILFLLISIFTNILYLFQDFFYYVLNIMHLWLFKPITVIYFWVTFNCLFKLNEKSFYMFEFIDWSTMCFILNIVHGLTLYLDYSSTLPFVSAIIVDVDGIFPSCHWSKFHEKTKAMFSS
jgi:hypothetical protein